MMKVGIVREGKIPADYRVPLSPQQCQTVITKFDGVEIIVQTSPIRCFPDEDYQKFGIEVREDLRDCDILLGVKEVPADALIPEKTYLFFSHTVNKPPYNPQLLQTMIDQKIRLIDYECLKNEQGNRVIGFGRYAGIVGTYNSLLGYGQRYHLYTLKPIRQCFDLEAVKVELKNVKLPAIKIAVTGWGRVARGVREILDGLHIQQVTPTEYLTQAYTHPVYTQLNPTDYHKNQQGFCFNQRDFFQNPEQFEGDFYKYAQVTDLLINGAYWQPRMPVLFSSEEMVKSDFNIRLIGDISCDIHGAIPATKRPSTLELPFYDYNRQSQKLEAPFNREENVTVMAIDNLPSGLPRDASEAFGNRLIEQVFPHLFRKDSRQMIAQATVTTHGKITQYFSYLQDYLEDFYASI